VSIWWSSENIQDHLRTPDKALRTFHEHLKRWEKIRCNCSYWEWSV
jgi:hypothetical protein